MMDRFLAKVDRSGPGECWLWTGAKSNGGYGKFAVNRKLQGAHRVSYEMYVGPIPDSHTIDHLCKNPSCVNPAHLEAVTERENLLRGDGFAGRNHRKTHCIHGHPLTGDNVQWVHAKGRLPFRSCRYCKALAKRTAPDKLKRAPNKTFRVPVPVCDEGCSPQCEKRPDGVRVFYAEASS